MARSRFRSVRYDLAASVEVARLVDSAGGSVAADVLAPALGYSGTNNGAYLTRVANARLFGVVAGRGSRFEMTERGRRILTGAERDAAEARREAFLAVPLFRAVAEVAEPKGGMLPDDLASWLVSEFGETEAKAQTAADRLISSAAQAHVLTRSPDGKLQLRALLTNFTPVEKSAPSSRTFHRLWSREKNQTLSEEAAVAENGLWLDEDPSESSKRIPVWRRAGVIAAAAVVLVVVAVPVAFVAAGAPSTTAAGHKPTQHPRLGDGPAEHQVLSALSATTDSGNFDFSYRLSSTVPKPAHTVTPTTQCREIEEMVPDDPANAGGSGAAQSEIVGTAVGSGYAGRQVVPSVRGRPPRGYKWLKVRSCFGTQAIAANPLVQGSGVIDTSPLAMVASADIGNGLRASVRIDGTDIYEESSGDTGLAPLPADATETGSAIPGFANLTEGTLGTREGAAGMLGMSSPTGYLDLVQPAIDAAAKTGTGTVDGTPVTIYQVSNNLAQLAAAAGTTSAESQAIADALGVLKGQGFTTDTVKVAIDAAGYIRQVTTTDSFSDGGSVTLESTFWNFGCAGTVLMPGQTGSGTPPANCTSPDGPSQATPSQANPSQATKGSTPPASVGSDTPAAVPPTVPVTRTTVGQPPSTLTTLSLLVTRATVKSKNGH